MSAGGYVVTDIETDGPWVGPNSMRSFASVAITTDGVELGVFEAVLDPLPEAQPDPDTYAWFQTQGDAWAAATTDARPITTVMGDYVDWIKGLGMATTFASCPLAFDGVWIDHYLRRFTRYGLAQGPSEQDRLFAGPGLCIASYAAAVLAKPFHDFSPADLPPEWLGNVRHTHRAIDDARGYAHLLGELHRRTGAG